MSDRPSRPLSLATASREHATSDGSPRGGKRRKGEPIQQTISNNTTSGSTHMGNNYYYHAPVDHLQHRTQPCEHQPQDLTTRRQGVLDRLKYEEMDDHCLTTETDQTSTCQWLFEKDEYVDWLNATKLSHHHGLLWIKGKPGSGKTTLMKSAYQHTYGHRRDCTLVSFFFNARHGGLATSTEGMYRSLLCQLLANIPGLQCILDEQVERRNWPVSTLSNLFRKAVLALGTDRLFCYIDALDECPEAEIRIMTQFFEGLAKSAMAQGIGFHACFSSRHYSNIKLEKCRNLILEDQEDHAKDITAYIRKELRYSIPLRAEITTEIRRRASGIFLWVYLVVKILNDDDDHGLAHMIKARLNEIPDDLHKIFHDTVQRKTGRDAHLIPTLQCIMFAKRPLSCEELYHAVLHGSDTEIGGHDPEVIRKFILSSSKGLAERTKGKLPTVQFIHDSVRDYLCVTGFRTLLKERHQSIECLSHEYLRVCCLHFVSEWVLRRLSLPEPLPNAKSLEARELRTKASNLFPFLQYAVENMVFHTERACSGSNCSDGNTKPFPLSAWRVLHNMFQQHEDRKYSASVTNAYVFAERDAPHLLRVELQREADLYTTERHGSLLRAAVFQGNSIVIATILEHHRITSHPPKEQGECLAMALKKGFPEVADLLIRGGVDIDVRSKDYVKFLQMAYIKGYKQIVKMLLEMYAKGDTRGGHYNGALLTACTEGFEQAAQLLLDSGAEINAQGGHYGNALQAASAHGHENLVQTLLLRGARADAQGGYHGSALRAAYAWNHLAVADLLNAHMHGANSDNGQIERDQAPGLPALWPVVSALMRCTEPLCRHMGSWCWCDTSTDKHYRLSMPHLKRLIRHKEAGKILESHDDIPDDLRRQLTRKDSGV
jgi:hypothetical protein